MTQTYTLSVFLPAYNEAENLSRVVREIADVLARTPAVGAYELIVVDDGSTDATTALLADLQKTIPQLRTVRHSRNLGYGSALASGFAEARNELVFFMDADGQFSFREFPVFLLALKEKDVVVGFRKSRNDPSVRRLFGKCWSALVRNLLGVRARDINCAFKLMRRSALSGFAPRSSGAGINAELLMFLEQKGAKLAELPVQHFPRTAGVATGLRFPVIVRAVLELLRLSAGRRYFKER